MKILMTGTSTFFATKLVQEFGRNQHLVTAADSLRRSAGKASKYSTSQVLLPKLGEDPGAYIEAVCNELDQQQYDLLLPTFEESLLISEHRHELESRTRLLLPQFGTALDVHCKPVLHRLCQLWGIPSPTSYWPAGEADLLASSSEFSFPVVLKLPMGNNAIGKVVCYNQKELMVAYQSLIVGEQLVLGEQPFVQQQIDGDMICTLMFCQNGEKLGEVIYRYLRCYPDSGGTSAHRVSITHPEIETLTKKFATQTDWSGFVGLDFIVDRHTKIPYLIDVNPRANPAVNLGFLAGVDWTTIITELLQNRQTSYVLGKPGLCTKSQLIDLAWLLEGMKPGENWLARSQERLSRFIRPEWTVHERDMPGWSDWRANLQISWHSLQALIRAKINNVPLGRTIIEDANYNAHAAAKITGRDLAALYTRATQFQQHSRAA